MLTGDVVGANVGFLVFIGDEVDGRKDGSKVGAAETTVGKAPNTKIKTRIW